MFALTARTARPEAGLRLRGRAPKARVACAPWYVAWRGLWNVNRAGAHPHGCQYGMLIEKGVQANRPPEVIGAPVRMGTGSIHFPEREQGPYTRERMRPGALRRPRGGPGRASARCGP